MGAKIQSTDSTDELKINSAKAAHATNYDATGREVSLQSKQAFSVTTANFTPDTAATDIFTIKGSATKTIRIMQMTFSGTATALAIIDLFLIKRSAANTGGTFVEGTAVKHDSQNSGSTAVVGHYTANPTGLGAAVGTIKKVKCLLPIASSPVAMPNNALLDRAILEQPIALRGTSEILALNFNGATLPVGSANWSVTILFIEE